jgi:hypothetical protein
VAVIDNVKLALAEGVPELDGLVSGRRNDLSVVGRERHGEDIASVANKLLGGKTRVQVPKTESLVPRRGQGELSVGGDDNVRDKVVVAVEDLLGETERCVVSGQLPNNDCLVAGGSQDHVRVLGAGGNGGNTTSVALEGTLENEGVRHGFCEVINVERLKKRKHFSAWELNASQENVNAEVMRGSRSFILDIKRR